MFKGLATDVMGSRLELKFAGVPEKKAYGIWSDVTRELSRLDGIFNADDPESEVSVLNASKVDIETSEDMKLALNLCESYLIGTKGLFDINRGGREDLDFGGFAKGYALRRIAALLKSAKVKDAFADFGGSVIMALGKQPYSDCWTYTLLDPWTDDELEQIELRSECLAVSCNSPQRSGHIVNPLNGQIEGSHRMSLVRAADPLDAQVLALVMLLASAQQKTEIAYNYKKAESRIIELA